MPSKKKGKKKKPLTEEEKVKQAETKALADKEKLVRRRRLTNAFLKLKKDKEIELIKLNDNKLLDLWRPRLRKLKCNELLDDYQMLKAAFERNFRKKDELISDLEGVLRQNDEEYDNAFDMHIHNIDQLLEFYRKRLNEVREMYGSQKQKLMDVLNDEKFRMQSYQEKSLRYLNGVITAVNMRYRELASDSKAELFIRQEEIRNKALEETHAAKQETDKKMKAVWDDIQGLLVEYDTKITPLRNEFQELKKKDDMVVSTVDAQFRKMYKIQTGIENLAEKDRNYCEALQKFLEELNSKRDDLKVQYKQQQERFEMVAKVGRENIRQLALVSTMVLESIDGMTSQRERLMKCIERCRKRERLDEKVDPFMLRWSLQELPGTTVGEEDEAAPYLPATEQSDGFNIQPKRIEHNIACECNPCTCEVEDETTKDAINTVSIQQYSLMERFWVRYNRACLERSILCQRKEAMQKDNYQLKLALRNYMGGLNPLQHNMANYSDTLMKTGARNYQIMVRGMLKEWKRRERCRKVGGIRVH